MKNPLQQVLVYLVVMSLCGCVTRSDKIFSMSDRKQQAIKLEKRKHLADALWQWQIISAASPEDKDAQQAITRLERQIDTQLVKLQGQVKKQNSPEQQRLLHLKILALQPANQQAIAALRQLEWGAADQAASDKSASMANWQRKPATPTSDKAQKSSAATSSPSLASASQLTQINKLLDSAEHRLREQQWEQAGELLLQASDLSQPNTSGRLLAMKKQLSQQYYSQGMRVLTSNLEQAIDDLQTSLWFDPDNIKARIQLSRASTMKQNLEEIRNPK
ncbi:hypothetical protein [Bowmanella pacifica]|uniref:Lipoprotein n=1 Tax=Bowmanella pacifica TaxID=502051 RepID=A0A917YX26_9ALTE|nr:hypothetical protein [Bowmanella pacifica]GGO66711.1 hypothetical protein GCM10010982_11550 [Bowmanella pacifica]